MGKRTPFWAALKPVSAVLAPVALNEPACSPALSLRYPSCASCTASVWLALAVTGESSTRLPA